MKLFKEVEANRQAYHRDPSLNSVHRSSLMVPVLAGAEADISLVNHFLLKRGYKNIGCRITAIDSKGKRIESRLHPLSDPCVYTFSLKSALAGKSVSTYMVEFFSAENLFIPFPAVMINYKGEGFISSVHSYNRVLNDIFEEDSINAVQPPEASIDVRLSPNIDTFFTVMAGPRGFESSRDRLQVALEFPGHTKVKEFGLDLPRFNHRTFTVRETFGELSDGERGVLKITQPHHFLFYGRLLVGNRHNSGAFSANHSYYDNSSVAEYWEDSTRSERMYPYFSKLLNVIRMYPIFSPCELQLSAQFYDSAGKSLGTQPFGTLKSPSSQFVEAELQCPGASSFSLITEAPRGTIPTRVNHQLIWRAKSEVEASVNVSLFNARNFKASNRSGFAWGQLAVGPDLDSILGIVGNTSEGQAAEVEVNFYGEKGLLSTHNRFLPPSGSVQLRPSEVLKREELASSGPYVWYIVRSARPDLSTFVVTEHLQSGHCTGEHGF